MDILEKERYIVNKEYGIISENIDVQSVFGLPFIHRMISDVNIKEISDKYDIKGYGYSFLEKNAKRKAMGEALERYAGALGREDKITCEFQKLQNVNEIDIDLVRFFDSDLYQVNNLNNKSIDWERCTNIYNGEKKYFPLFWIKYPYFEKGEDYSFLGSTSGMAAAISEEKAIENSICECLERHICAEWWLKRKNTYKIDIKQLDHFNQSILKHFADCALKIEIYYLENEWNIPCYAARIINVDIHNFPKRPLNYMVAKVGRGDNLHVTSLLEELIGGYYSLLEIYNDKEYLLLKKNNISIQNALYYGKKFVNMDYKNLENIDLIIEGKNVTEIAIDNQIPIYIKNITPCDLESLDIVVYKAISTKLLRIHDGYLFGKGVYAYDQRYPFI